MKKYINLQNRNSVEMGDILGDAMGITGSEDINEDEVLSSARFGIVEMEDVLGDTLDEMGYNDDD